VERVMLEEGSRRKGRREGWRGKLLARLLLFQGLLRLRWGSYSSCIKLFVERVIGTGFDVCASMPVTCAWVILGRVRSIAFKSATGIGNLNPTYPSDRSQGSFPFPHTSNPFPSVSKGGNAIFTVETVAQRNGPIFAKQVLRSYPAPSGK